MLAFHPLAAMKSAKDQQTPPVAEASTDPVAAAPAAAPDSADGAPAAAADEAPVPIEEDTAGPAEAAAPDPAEELRKLAAERDDAVKRVAETKDRLLRMAADFENYRKRMAKQEEETRDRARIDALRGFLPVVDNVERALSCTKGLPGGDTMAQGLDLVLRSFFESHAGLGLARIEAVGKAFDPLLHEAVGNFETTETPPGCVAQEMLAGYRLKDKLLRPAMVLVARPPQKAAAPAPADTSADKSASEAAAPAATVPAAGGDGPTPQDAKENKGE
jgi:molecular chaperone GrpE